MRFVTIAAVAGMAVMAGCSNNPPAPEEKELATTCYSMIDRDETRVGQALYVEHQGFVLSACTDKADETHLIGEMTAADPAALPHPEVLKGSVSDEEYAELLELFEDVQRNPNPVVQEAYVTQFLKLSPSNR